MFGAWEVDDGLFRSGGEVKGILEKEKEERKSMATWSECVVIISDKAFP